MNTPRHRKAILALKTIAIFRAVILYHNPPSIVQDFANSQRRKFLCILHIFRPQILSKLFFRLKTSNSKTNRCVFYDFCAI